MKPRPDGRPGLWRRLVACTLGTVLTSSTLLFTPGHAAEPPPSKTVEVPQADILDVSFTGGRAHDRVAARQPITKGAPVFSTDPDHGDIATFDGVDDGISFPIADAWQSNSPANITETLTLQCVFRADTADTGQVCSNQQSGGIAIRVSPTTVFATFHLGGGYRTVQAPLTVGRWHDVVATYDGNHLTLYLDGDQAARQAHTGPLGIPLANARALALGADSGADGNIESPSATTVAAARLWGSALSADEVAKLHTDGAPMPPAPEVEARAPEADLVDVTFLGGRPADIAQGREAFVNGDPTYATDDQHGDTASFDGTDDGIAFPIADAWNSVDAPNVADGLTMQCVLRLDRPASGGVCSNQQSGGLAIHVSATEVFGTVHLGGAYRRVQAPLAVGVWHDVVMTYDGTDLVLFVNGEEVARNTFAGPIGAPLRDARYLAIGADSSSDGRVESPSPSTVAAARLWGSALSSAQVADLHEQGSALTLPTEADVLDIDLAAGTTDLARNVPAKVLGVPRTFTDVALEREVVSFDGSSQLLYDLGDVWDTGQEPRLHDQFSVQCTFRFDGDVPTGPQSICGQMQSGGFGVQVDGTTIKVSVSVGGYRTLTAPLGAGQWHNVVTTYDGTQVRLFVDGVQAGRVPVTGVLQAPLADARNLVLGGDAGSQGKAELPSRSTVATARLWSSALSAREVYALDHAEFGDRDAGVRLEATTPDVGERLTEPVVFRADIAKRGAATDWHYTVDGEEIQPGQLVGSGFAAGDHTLRITATDLFGKKIDWKVPFTSKAIPKGGSTKTGQGDGEVRLSAIAHATDGGEVTTTFKQAPVTLAEGGFQGTVPTVPSTLDFTYDEGEQIDGAQVEDGDTSTSPTSHGRLPFQRYDVAVPAEGERPTVRWSGVVDPAREVSLRVWDTATDEWRDIASSRGNPEGATLLQGDVPTTAVDKGEVHVLVLAIDPFADDLAPRDASAAEPALRDRFESPDDYDFSFVHWTDPQFLAQGATGNSGKWPASITWPSTSGIQTPEEQAVWAKAYTDALDWTVANAEERKISYLAVTGDIVNDVWAPDPEETDADGNLLHPGLREAGTQQMTFAERAFRTLDGSPFVTQVIAGNHDNRLGTETGPESEFSRTFRAEKYYDEADSWDGDASYHTWDEATDADGTVIQQGKDSQNNYVLFTAGGLDFVAVGLSYGVTQEEVEWANEVLSRHRDRNAIVLTHSYLNPSANPDGRGAGFASDDLGELGVIADGERLWNKVVSRNDNVFLVLSGHTHGSGINLKTVQGKDSTHKVVELLADYQSYGLPAQELFTEERCPTCVTVNTPDAAGNTGIDVDGDGVVDHRLNDELAFGPAFLRLLQFNTRESTLSVDTYSPFFDEFGATEYERVKRYNGAEDNFTVPVDLTTRTTTFETDGLAVIATGDTVIGTESGPSGWPIEVTWTGLNEGQTYAWTATSENADGGRIDQFGGIFVASAAGTDTTPPVISVPKATKVKQKSTFDPLAGVTATDNSDGDVTSAITVVGSVNTAVPGHYNLLYSVADTNGNVVQATRRVTVVAGKSKKRVVSSLQVRVQPKAVRAKQHKPVIRVKVKARGVTPGGKVTVRIGKRSKTVRVHGGVARVKFGKFAKKGKRHAVVTYTGDSVTRPAATVKAFMVRKPPKRKR